MKTYTDFLSAMQQTYSAHTGFIPDAGSDIGIRFKALASVAAGLYEDMMGVMGQVFPQTSTGDCLEYHAQTRGITRKSAISAQGILRFLRETPASGDIELPSGIICATRPQPQMQFQTTTGAVLPAGELYVDVPAQGALAGTQSNVASGSVCIMVSTAPGFSAVTNPTAFVGGVDEESDSTLRERLLLSYQNISNGSNSAFYYDIAMQHEGVSSANILPRNRGRGTVDVVVTCSQNEAQTIADLTRNLSERKEINVDVLVTSAKKLTVNISIEIAIKDGVDFEHIKEQCQRKIKEYISALGVGKPLLLSAMGARLLEVDGVFNYHILSPTADVWPNSDQVVVGASIAASRMAVG